MGLVGRNAKEYADERQEGHRALARVTGDPP
jgi:hypothetical protein